MKPVRWSVHAKLKLLEREVDQAEAERTLTEPDEILPADASRVIYQRTYFDAALSQDMLLRLVVEDRDQEQVILTVYKTSRLDKYRR